MVCGPSAFAQHGQDATLRCRCQPAAPTLRKPVIFNCLVGLWADIASAATCAIDVPVLRYCDIRQPSLALTRRIDETCFRRWLSGPLVESTSTSQTKTRALTAEQASFLTE